VNFEERSELRRQHGEPLQIFIEVRRFPVLFAQHHLAVHHFQSAVRGGLERRITLEKRFGTDTLSRQPAAPLLASNFFHQLGRSLLFWHVYSFRTQTSLIEPKQVS
jgi:hypothetical protein